MNQKGFTIIEILIALAVGIIALFAIYAVVDMGRQTAGAIEIKVTAGQDARAAIELMAMEIQMASYNPSRGTDIWKSADNPTQAADFDKQLNRGIQEATSASITIEMDLNGNGVIGDANEVIRYAYDKADLYISRSTGNLNRAEAFLGDTEEHAGIRTVRVINADAPVFRYYNGRNQLIADPGNNIPQIRRVEITLMIETNDISPDSKQRRQMTYNTSVIPRNHASN